MIEAHRACRAGRRNGRAAWSCRRTPGPRRRRADDTAERPRRRRRRRRPRPRRLPVIESAAIHEQLAYLLDHLPAARPRGHRHPRRSGDPARAPAGPRRARRDPGERPPLLRGRSRGLPRGDGAALGDGDVAALEGRTEGWIAALQLAALSLQGRTDATEFITAFAGDDRYIVDYLVEEVLAASRRDVRDFLLETSILPRFTRLARATRSRPAGRRARRSRRSSAANLFVVALDSQRRWYRYHHLFADVLQAHLAAERPDADRRCSTAARATGSRRTAIGRRRSSTPSWRETRTARPSSSSWRFPRCASTGASRRSAAGWTPCRDAVLARRPVLAAALAGAILLGERGRGRREPADARPNGGSRVGPVVDRRQTGRAPAAAGDDRAVPCRAREDSRAISRATSPTPGGSWTWSATTTTSDAAAPRRSSAWPYWGMGDLESGYRWYTQGMASLERGGLRRRRRRRHDRRRRHPAGAGAACATRSGSTRTGSPARPGASRRCAAQPTCTPGWRTSPTSANELDEAGAHLEAGRRLGDEFGFPREPYRSARRARAHPPGRRRQLDPALTLLDEAERLYLSDFSPDIHPVPAIRARILVAHGRPAEAQAWARRRASRPTTRSRTSASSSTRRWLGSSSPRRRGRRRRAARGASAARPAARRRDRGRRATAAASRSSSSRRSPGTRPATSDAAFAALDAAVSDRRAGGLRPRLPGRGARDDAPR